MKPVLQAVLLAEHVYEDKTGKKIIAGTFNRMTIGTVEAQAVRRPDGTQVAKIPGGSDIGCPSVYISLTDVAPGTEFTLAFVNVSRNTTLLEVKAKVMHSDRLGVVELVVPMPPIARMVREKGVYSLDVMFEGEILGSHRLVVESLDKKDP